MAGDWDKAVDAFIAHWRGLPRGNDALLPHLRTFLDHAEPSLQPYVALVDIVERDNWTLRLYGTGRVNSFGRDLSGINPIDVYAPAIRPLLQDSIMTVIGQPCGWRSTRRVTTEKGLSINGSGVTLPLATDETQPACIVNFMVFSEAIAHNDRQGVVDDIPTWAWLDIGAGVPKS